MRKPAVLYISYDGMLEPLGQSQVITYLERLTGDAKLHVISYEKPADWADDAKRALIVDRLQRAGIVWHPLTYHKHPTIPATLYDITQGLVVALWLAARHNVRIIHARSYIPALIGWVVKLLTGAKLLFDMRGLWADERADGGIWPRGGRVYRAVKRLEKTLLFGADHIVTLTHASKAAIEAFPYFAGKAHAPITVIPTCADLDRFRLRDAPVSGQSLMLGYLGSIGPWYRFDDMLRLFTALRRKKPDTRLLVINRAQQEEAWRMIDASDVPRDACEVVGADHSEVDAQVRRMDIGMALMRPAYCELGRAPTRLAEYLGSGVLCVGNNGIGDVADILTENRVGVVADDFTDAAVEGVVGRILSLLEDTDLPGRCRDTALALFDLSRGAQSYRTIYQALSS